MGLLLGGFQSLQIFCTERWHGGEIEDMGAGREKNWEIPETVTLVHTFIDQKINCEQYNMNSPFTWFDLLWIVFLIWVLPAILYTQFFFLSIYYLTQKPVLRFPLKSWWFLISVHKLTSQRQSIFASQVSDSLALHRTLGSRRWRQRGHLKIRTA